MIVVGVRNRVDATGTFGVPLSGWVRPIFQLLERQELKVRPVAGAGKSATGSLIDIDLGQDPIAILHGPCRS
jgi:hypothetical protein